MFLTNFSLKRPVFATVIIIVLLTLGVVSYTSLSVDQFPDVDTPAVSITIVENGAAPDQIESKVTKKVEDAVGQISGVDHINSTITQGVSNTTIIFKLSKSSAEAVQDVKDKLSNIRGTLPTNITEPVVAKYDSAAQPIVSLAVTGSMSGKSMSELVDDDIVKKIQTISGVGGVNTYGEHEREIHFKLDKDKINEYGITVQEITKGLSSDNIDASNGKISASDTDISLKTDSTVKDIKDFSNVLIANRNGTNIKLGDIASIEDGSKEMDSLSFYNGREAIGIDVLKQSGSNTVDVADNIKNSLSKIEKGLPKGVKVELVRDNSTSIRDSVKDVQKTLVEGCILAVVVVFLFLRNIASTAISGITIPVSIISTFSMMKLMNFSLNTVSLMALSIAVGLLIDDAIVVIENIVRHLNMGKGVLQAAKDGTAEIGLAVMATTFALVAVFLPIAMINGLIGKFLVQFGLTVSASVLVSLFVAFTLVPLMSSKYLNGEEKKIPLVGGLLDKFNEFFDRVSEAYAKFLKVALEHRLLVIVIPLLMLVGSIGLATKLNSGFIATGDTGEIEIEADLDSGSSLDNASDVTYNMEKIIKSNKEVKYTYSTVTQNKTSIFVKLSDKQDRKQSIDEIEDSMRDKLQSIPGISISVVTGGGFIPGKGAQYHITGNNFDKLEKYARKAERVMKNTQGAVDVALSYKAGKPEVDFEVDRDKAADLGVSPDAISSTLTTLFNGTVVGQYQTSKDRYDIRVQLRDSDKKNLDSLDGIYVPSTSGSMIPLDQVSKKVFTTSSSTINRYDRQREIQLTGNYTGISQGKFQKLFNEGIEENAKIPDGIEISSGGSQEQMADGMSGLVTALGMGILFVFLVIAAQFESFVDPFAILLSLPLAIIGAILGLFIGGKELDMMSMIGVIMLMGLVTKNGILLIDFAKKNYGEGMDLKDALVEAGRTRIRPIVMTTLAMIFGMLPTALANGSGSELRAPMAFAIIGGLITSTLLTLFFVPAIYVMLNNFKSRFKRKKKTN